MTIGRPPEPSPLDIYAIETYSAPTDGTLYIRFLKYEPFGGHVTVKEIEGKPAERIMQTLDTLPTSGQKEFAVKVLAFGYDIELCAVAMSKFKETVLSGESPICKELFPLAERIKLEQQATEYDARIITDNLGYAEIELFKGAISDCKIIKIISGSEVRQRLAEMTHLTIDQRIEVFKQLARMYDLEQQMAKLKEKENGQRL